MFFTDGEGASSHLDLEPSKTKVRVLALDDVLVGVRPTYIKLDIEGFEAEALRGAQKTIALCKPSLAVCIYHKPEDLWTLPELVMDLCPESDLYMRQHGHNGFDTVLYAINRI
nr:FkbM family methyltransferase [Beijerinckia sp. L45]